MITYIRVKNFKSWENSPKVELAPLTGFFGTNSSGKSSLLQMLLLLKQTVEHSDPEKVIFFGDEHSLVNLGNFREVIHGHNIEATLGLELGCTTQNPFAIELLQQHRYGYSSPSPLDIDSFTVNAVIQARDRHPVFGHVCYAFGVDNELQVKWKSGSLIHPNRYESNVNLRNFYDGSGPSEEDLLEHLTSSFEKLLAHVYPLAPTRVQPKRCYHWEGSDPENIGHSGEDMIEALLAARVDQQTTPYEGRNVLIQERISAWLREMDLAYSFSIKRTAQGAKDYNVLIQKSPDSAKVTLADMGYGLAQFLPVLVHCYYAPEGSTLILEQPGMHLHPKAQADLADLLVEVVTERKLQILVESHSEHLLTRLQLGIAEQKIASNETALYFCENKNGVSTIKSLEVDELGNIKNWPKDFFGNVRGDLVKMAREQMKRQKKAED